MITLFFAASCVWLSANTPVEADFVVTNTTIHDGSGKPAQQGDVAVRGDRIVAVGKFETAGNPRKIDGTGLIIAPGFIDLHNHSDDPITHKENRKNRNFLLQGCTTIVTGNCGGGRVDVGKYLEQIDGQGGAGTNVAHLVPAGSVRQRAMGGGKRPPSPEELNKMRELVRQGMRDGAFGMSTGLIYTPGSFAATEEIIELAKVVAEFGGIYATHMRNEGSGLLESIQETLTIGRQAHLPVHISHFKVSGRNAWGLAPDAIRSVAEAREKGDRVTADQYPYIASSTSLAAMVMPDEVRTKQQLEKTLADQEATRTLRAELEQAIAARDGGQTLVIAKYDPKEAWQGKNLKVIAEQEKKSVIDLVIEIQLNGGARAVSFGMNEDEVRLIMQQPFVATASDGSAMSPDDTVPHPRSYGTFPRKIGRYALDGKFISLEQAIRSSSGLTADILGLENRGYIRPNHFADLVIFDPAAFRDIATFDQPHQYATGARFVFINGQLAVENGETTDKLCGRALRHRPVQSNP